MRLSEPMPVRRLTLCALYFAQGIPWGFTTIALPAYLGARGMTTEAIGVALATTALPFSFKWLWGPIIDALSSTRFGRRRPWIVLAQLMMAVTLLAMVSVDDVTTDMTRLVWLLFAHTCFSALQDVAVDALAIDVLEEHERGRVNGLMNASRYAGGILGGAGMSWVMTRTSLHATVIAQAVLLLALTMIPLLLRERGVIALPRRGVTSVLRSLAVVFSLRSSVVTAVLMLVLTIPIGLVSANSFALFTQRLGWSSDAYAQLTGGVGLVVGFVASIVGGQLADRVGHRRMMAIASIAMACGWLSFGLLSSWWSSTAFVYAMALFEQVCMSVLLVCIFALCMDVSSSATAATQFAAYVAMSNISGALGYRFAGVTHGWLDFAGCYLVAAGVQLAVTLLLPFIDPRQTVRELPLPDGAAVPRRGVAAVVALALVLAVSTAYVMRVLL